MTKDRINDIVESNREEMLKILETFVNIDTGSYTIEGINKLSSLIKTFLEKLGFEAEYISSEIYAPHLIARKKGSGKKKMLCLAHMDTVFDAPVASQRPFKIEEGKAYGPGVADMQSGIVCLLYVMKILSDESFDNFASITLLFNSDEERGSATSESTILEESAKADVIFVFEPGAEPNDICIERKGGGIFNLEVWGKPAHAGGDPQAGIHALEEVAHKMLAMHAETNYEKMRTISVGVVKGGTRSNIIPEYVFAEIDIRCKTNADGDYLMKRMQEITDHSYVVGTKSKLTKVMYRPPLEKTPENIKLYELYRDIGAEFGISISESLRGGGSDGNYGSGLGIPVVDSLGAVGENAHTDDEYIVLESLFERTKIGVRFIEAYCAQ